MEVPINQTLVGVIFRTFYNDYGDVSLRGGGSGGGVFNPPLYYAGDYCRAINFQEYWGGPWHSGEEICSLFGYHDTGDLAISQFGLPGPILEDAYDWFQWSYYGTWYGGVYYIYWGDPYVVPDRSTLSSCGSGTSGHDTRECPNADYQNTQGFAGGPINTGTGGYDFGVVDLSIPTSAGPLTFEREYASSATELYTTTLGYGWTHNHDIRLILSGDPGGEEGVVWFKAHSANQYRFIDRGDGTYHAYPGVLASLTFDTGTLRYTLVNSAQATYTFDDAGRLLSWSDPQGHVLTYEYDGSGRLSRVSAPESARYLDFAYDPMQPDRLIGVSDHTGRQVQFGYTGNHLTTVTDLLGQAWTYVYDNPNYPHALTQVVDPRGIVVERTEYDGDGRAVRQYDGRGQLVVELVYNADGTTTLVDALGNQATHAYDFRRTLVGQADALGGVTDKAYDANFRPVSLTDPLDHMTRLNWSDNGANLQGIGDADGHITQMSYDALNNLTAVTNPLGFETSYTYSGTLLLSSTDALGNTTQYTYTTAADYPQPAGLLKAVADPLGNLTRYTYDEYGQRIAVVDALDQTTAYTYDDLGRLQTVTDSAGRTDWTCYNAAGWVTRTVANAIGDGGTPQTDPCDADNYVPSTDPAFDRIRETRYDPVGNVIATIDPAGRITRTYYDAANRPVTVVQNLVGQPIEDPEPPERSGDPAQNLRTDTVYDANNNGIATIDPAGIVTRTYYDPLNRPEYVVQNLVGQPIEDPVPPPYDPDYPDENVRTQTMYDAAGNVVQTIDNAERVTHFCYDALNRVVKTIQNPSVPDPCPDYTPSAEPDQDVIQRTVYDANGNTIATIDPLGIVTRTYYDALHRLVAVVRNLTGDLYAEDWPAYSPAFPDQNVRTEYVYDANGNQIGVLEAQTESDFVITRTYYDALGRPDFSVRNLANWDLTNPAPPPLTLRTNDANVTTQTVYDPATGDAIATINWLVEDGEVISQTTRTYYDELHRPVAVVQNLEPGWNVYAGEWPDYSLAFPDRNVRTEYVYDARGDQIAVVEVQTEAERMATRTYYDALGRATTVVQNLVGQPIEDPEPPERNPANPDQNVRTDTTYAVTGNVIASTDPLTRTTTFAYDDLNRQLSRTDPLDHTTAYAYDAAGLQARRTDAAGVVTVYEYDDLDRLVAVIENYRAGFPPDVETNVRTEYTYDKNGNRLTLRDANAVLNGTQDVTIFAYDALNRLASERDPLGHTWAYGYDALGNRTVLTDANGATTGYAYDPLGRLTAVDYPAPDTDVFFAYNALGWRTAITDGVGVTVWAYDGLGRPLAITGPLTGTVGYTYDGPGLRTGLLYPDGKTAAYAYDVLHRLIQVTDWASGVITYTYDAAGQLLATSLPNGVTSAYTYDDAGRLLNIEHATAADSLSTFVFGYDAVGKRTATTETVQLPIPPDPIFADSFESGDFTAWSLAVNDPDLSVTPAAALVGAYGMQVTINDGTALYVRDDTPQDETRFRARFYFDPNTIQMADGDGHDLFQGRAANGTPILAVHFRRIPGEFQIRAAVRDDGNTWLTTGWQTLSDAPHFVEVAWAAATAAGANDGRLALWVDDQRQGSVVDVDNDTWRVDRVLLGGLGSLDPGTQGTYYFDAFESRQQTHIGADDDQPVAITYTYDPLSRLTAADYDTGLYYHYTYDPVGNWLLEESHQGVITYTYDTANRLVKANGVSFQWDANGNLLNDGENDYAYDHANRLIQVSGLYTTVLTYNGLGDRLQQGVDGVTTTYTLDLAAGLTQVLADGTNMYLYGVSRIAQQTPNGMQYFLGDALDSVRQLANATGHVILAQGYAPYGEVQNSTGGGDSSYGFTGEWTDATGLVYLRARYYAPGVGRFLSRDTWAGDYTRPMSYNAWLYVHANPVNLTDPAGTDPIDDIVNALRDETEECYNKGDLSCVWRNYYALAVGGNLLGYTHAADHLFQFLFKRGDINYTPVPSLLHDSSYWVFSSNAVQTVLPARESEILSLIHSKAKSGELEGHFETDQKQVSIPNKTFDRDLYYAMNIFSLWAEVDYEVSGCYEVTVKPTFRFWDAYDWHVGLIAGGPAIGVAGFSDEWTAALHDAGMALEYEISGYWFGPNEVFTFPTNWLNLDIPIPPISERPAPAR